MFSQLIFVGNLGRDPEMRFTPSGREVTNLSVATNRRWTDSEGETQEETIWFRVSVWGKQAIACNEYLAKGRQVLVIGRLRADEFGNPRTYTRADGSIGTSFEVNARTVRFLGGRNGAGAEADEDPTGIVGPVADEATEDEIPF